MFKYEYRNGKLFEIPAEELEQMEKEQRIRDIEETTRPLTEMEVSRIIIQHNINSIIRDDAIASRAVEFHPTLKQDEVQTAETPLISAGTRVNWKGKLKKAAVDLWDTEANNPDNAPNLWADLAYRDGCRIIPFVITVTEAFSKGEKGWWEDVLYRSKVDGNVYTPAQYPDNWEVAG